MMDNYAGVPSKQQGVCPKCQRSHDSMADDRDCHYGKPVARKADCFGCDAMGPTIDVAAKQGWKIDQKHGDDTCPDCLASLHENCCLTSDPTPGCAQCASANPGRSG